MKTELKVPDLGVGSDEAILVSCWLIGVGDELIEGDRIVELLIDNITFDVACPCNGRLKRIDAETDDRVQIGSVLGIIEEEN